MKKKGNDNPSTVFYWKDYENDHALRACSLAAQGLWMRMLCLAAKADPVGHVKIGSNPCTAQDLAKQAGEGEETVAALLTELERAGVYSLTRNGTIYSRRLIRDAKRSKTNAENGRKGGEASVRKQSGIFGSPKRTRERTAERPGERGSEPPYPYPIPTPLNPPNGGTEGVDGNGGGDGVPPPYAGHFSPTEYQRWIAVCGIALSGREALITAPTALVAEWLNGRLDLRLCRCLDVDRIVVSIDPAPPSSPAASTEAGNVFPHPVLRRRNPR